jgi:hypothetical protein
MTNQDAAELLDVNRRRAEQYAALEATAVSAEDEEDMDVVLERLRAARRVVARRRRSSLAT